MAFVVKNDYIQIRRFELGPFAANTYSMSNSLKSNQ
jgi:hypothetical protein